MSQQALNLKGSLQIIWRSKVLVGIITLLGLLGGVGYAVLRPPLSTSQALVVLPTQVRFDMSTEVVVATSDPVLKEAQGALRNVSSAASLQGLASQVHARSLTASIIAISAQAKTAAQAEDIANAVADSYVAFRNNANSPGGVLKARLLASAASPTGTRLPTRLIVYGVLGALFGLLIGAIIALAISRGDHRVRKRDEIADAIGVPVLASVPAGRPSDAAGWTKLLKNYHPGVVNAWNLRNTLLHLGLVDVDLASFRGGRGASLAVLSLSSDPGALALGPQLAVFAASLGIPTALVIGPQQDTNATATLRAACTGIEVVPSGRSNLRVIVRDEESVDRQQDAALKIVISVVDGGAPRVADTMRTTATVLAVSAGATTAEQLARVAASAADDDRFIVGIIVANPDPEDRTTGRVPQPSRPALRPTRLTGLTVGNRR